MEGEVPGCGEVGGAFAAILAVAAIGLGGFFVQECNNALVQEAERAKSPYKTVFTGENHEADMNGVKFNGNIYREFELFSPKANLLVKGTMPKSDVEPTK